MNKDEHYWTAMLLPQEHTDDELGYVVKRNCEKLALGLLDKLSDGKEYAIRMVKHPPILQTQVNRYVAEVRTECACREIVRCKDCKHTKDDGCGAIYCTVWDRWEMPKDYFCADGERRSE